MPADGIDTGALADQICQALESQAVAHRIDGRGAERALRIGIRLYEATIIQPTGRDLVKRMLDAALSAVAAPNPFN